MKSQPFFKLSSISQHSMLHDDASSAHKLPEWEALTAKQPVSINDKVSRKFIFQSNCHQEEPNHPRHTSHPVEYSFLIDKQISSKQLYEVGIQSTELEQIRSEPHPHEVQQWLSFTPQKFQHSPFATPFACIKSHQSFSPVSCCHNHCVTSCFCSPSQICSTCSHTYNFQTALQGHPLNSRSAIQFHHSNIFFRNQKFSPAHQVHPEVSCTNQHLISPPLQQNTSCLQNITAFPGNQQFQLGNEARIIGISGDKQTPPMFNGSYQN